MAPLRFAFGVHVHQPVGNFDHVIEEHVRDAYRPFLERLTEHGFVTSALHVSGLHLEWLEAHDRKFLDFIGRLAADVPALAPRLLHPAMAHLANVPPPLLRPIPPGKGHFR